MFRLSCELLVIILESVGYQTDGKDVLCWYNCYWFALVLVDFWMRICWVTIDHRYVLVTISCSELSTMYLYYSWWYYCAIVLFADDGIYTVSWLLYIHQEVFDILWCLSHEMHKRLEKLTCLLYASKAGMTNKDELRYNLFCSKKGESESHQVPPFMDCHMKHSLSSNHQAALWKESLQSVPKNP